MQVHVGTNENRKIYRSKTYRSNYFLCPARIISWRQCSQEPLKCFSNQYIPFYLISVDVIHFYFSLLVWILGSNPFARFCRFNPIIPDMSHFCASTLICIFWKCSGSLVHAALVQTGHIPSLWVQTSNTVFKTNPRTRWTIVINGKWLKNKSKGKEALIGIWHEAQFFSTSIVWNFSWCAVIGLLHECWLVSGGFACISSLLCRYTGCFHPHLTNMSTYSSRHYTSSNGMQSDRYSPFKPFHASQSGRT